MRAILEALADGVVDEPEMVKRYLNTAQKDVMSLSALIDDLFQMSQLDAGRLPAEPCEVFAGRSGLGYARKFFRAGLS
jgi:signal transduction histidine kinase